MKVLDILKAIEAMGATQDRAASWASPVTSAIIEFQIGTPARAAAFLAQVGHESAVFSAVEENLNYSADSLQRVFRKYFPNPIIAAEFARQPERIANKVYASRMGNGPEETGDGWRFRGRGLIQVTGRYNYSECGKALGIDLLAKPELLARPDLAARSAGWYWQKAGCSDKVDAGDFAAVTRLINGGLIGHEHRLKLWERAKAALGVGA